MSSVSVIAPKNDAAFLERWSRQRTHRAPAVVIDRPVREHLEVLRLVPALRLRVLEHVGEADAFDRRLRDAANLRRRLDRERFEHGRNHVDRVRELRGRPCPSP